MALRTTTSVTPSCGQFVTVPCVTRRNRPDPAPDPLGLLGLGPDASADAIAEARRRLAKQVHPDAGGSVEAMQRVNAAAREALAMISPPSGATRRSTPRGSAGRRTRQRRTRTPGSAWRDHPSFTIEVLPVEAFEGLLVVASWLGELIHDDPPYLLEVALTDPVRGWCRLELVPDAGSSTVSLAVAAEPGYPVPDLDVVRDAWVDGLNRLDWTDPDRHAPVAPPQP